MASNKWFSIFIGLIFIGSIFTVFSFTGKSAGKVHLVIDSSVPSQRFDEEMNVYENMTVLQLVSGQVGMITLTDEGLVKCINNYCSNENGVWITYKNGIVTGNRLDSESVMGGDSVILRYELRFVESTVSESSNTTSASAVNESESNSTLSETNDTISINDTI